MVARGARMILIAKNDPISPASPPDHQTQEPQEPQEPIPIPRSPSPR